MPCGCQKTKRVYVVFKGDGTQETVETLVDAMRVVRASGGRYQQVSVPK